MEDPVPATEIVTETQKVPLFKEPVTRDVALTPVQPPAPSNALDMLNRWASDPNVSAEKIERLVGLLNQQENRRAEEAFNAAMALAQQEMRRVAADADNPQTRSRYASYAALDRALRPVYTKHGFGLSFDTADSPHELHVRVLCYASHAAGFSRTYHVDMPADGKGAKGGDVMTRTHATGSALSYGMRYLLKLIFNVAVGEDDDDGNAASAEPRANQKAAPEGYDEWLIDLEATADNGESALKTAWEKSPNPFRLHLTKHAPLKWAGLKNKARGVKA